MYRVDTDLGVQVIGPNLGEAWISLVEAIISEGIPCYDEGRPRRALDNVRFMAKTQSSDDLIIHSFGDRTNLEAMLAFTFEKEIMHDIDLTPSFGNGAKSYHQRIREGKLLEFVEKRLSLIPESKKAVMVFPTYEDYKQVLGDMKNDYLPCIVCVQFRLDGNRLNATFNFRSMDVYQKGHGNLIAIAKMAEILAKRIGCNLVREIIPGSMDGMIVDAHIYENTVAGAWEMLKRYGPSMP